ncbi:Uncharacterized protein BM_BM9081 [Brugia malayi]|uniref:Bm9081 n=2 Tax=Brugia TaxID=6278 RepID=A0A0K0JY15_BRUMA|nr:Uncharacterized protein BM_BM9081 [Brugia malayi]CDQ03579.1 Bm9081 [Brugia malayi]VDO17791.1 unnamed protein product [Brugia timori]VIO89868.1 Uncharacterized protein BM_BM9081 [Brugia malayi]
MVQHNLKKKVSLPGGVKQKRKMKTAKQGPKKGHQLIIAPKKPAAIQQAKIDTEITRTINDKNEQLLKGRANKDVGRTTTST